MAYVTLITLLLCPFVVVTLYRWLRRERWINGATVRDGAHTMVIRLGDNRTVFIFAKTGAPGGNYYDQHGRLVDCWLDEKASAAKVVVERYWEQQRRARVESELRELMARDEAEGRYR